MKTTSRPNLQSKKFLVSKSYIFLKEKEKRFVEVKFYQRLFVVFISFSTILIFPESPRELENICEDYNSRKLCNVW